MRAFKGLRTDPAPRYDVIIIGAGIGGLICANLLARAGVRVLLVEQHYMVGGYCSTFRRKGFTFDAATHFYPLLGNPMTITGQVLDQIGCQTKWIKMDPVDHFHFPDKTSFSVPADFDEYLTKLKTAFPLEVDAIDRFFHDAREAYLHGLLYYFRNRKSPELERARHRTLHQALDWYFHDPKLILLLSADCAHWGSPPSRTSFVFDSMLRFSYFLGNYYPEGGSQVFADDLARLIERGGGDILMHARVTRIVVEGGVATGVEIEAGRGKSLHTVRVDAGHVISNADLLLTLEQLLGREVVGDAAIASARRLRPSYPCFLTHIGLRGFPLEPLVSASGYHWRSWDPDRVADDAFKIFVPTMYEPRMAPAGGQIVILQHIMQFDYDAVDNWAAHKQEVEDDLMQRLKAAVPGIERGIVTCQSASALTSWRFTLNNRGAMLGWEMSPEQLGDNRPGIEGPAKNLFFVGHWTRPGGGITPVIVSAVQVARAITGR
jgi:phytoene dehydrogenase-like protein